MSSELLFKLEEKIDNAIETIELLRLEMKEAEERNNALMKENATLKSKQSTWEQNLGMMLQKLDAVDSKKAAVVQHQLPEEEVV